MRDRSVDDDTSFVAVCLAMAVSAGNGFVSAGQDERGVTIVIEARRRSERIGSVAAVTGPAVDSTCELLSMSRVVTIAAALVCSSEDQLS